MISVKRLLPGQLLTIEHVVGVKEPETPEPHQHDYYEIFWVKRGLGVHCIDHVELPLTPNEVHIVFPGQVHHVLEVPEELYALSFKPEVIEPERSLQQVTERFSYLSNSGLLVFNIPSQDKPVLQSIMDIAQRDLEQQGRESGFVLSLLASFLHLLSRSATNLTVDDFGDKRVSRVVSLIETHFRNHHDTGFYAEKLALSNKRLNEITRMQLSQTVTQLVHGRLILQAKRELTFTDQSVKSIGMNLGFSDIAYFCRFFKKVTGLSPVQYRNSSALYTEQLNEY